MNTWEDLSFWRSKEWASAQEKLDAMETSGIRYNPDRSNLFACFDNCPLDTVRVAIVGQDPYPDPRLANGMAFSIPSEISGFPPTLTTIFKEYVNDLGLPCPTTGDLTPWCNQGVLLYNTYTTCNTGRSLSNVWYEWYTLSTEVLNVLSPRPIVIILLGTHSRTLSNIIRYHQYLGSKVKLIELVHPSPRANIKAKTEVKFIGSRLFSRTNDYLVSLGKKPVDFRLP